MRVSTTATFLIGVLVIHLGAAGDPSLPVTGTADDEDPLFRITRDVVTPHTPWGTPLFGGPLRALCVANRGAHRDTVELAQRLELEFDAVVCGGERNSNSERLGTWMYSWGSRGTTDDEVAEDFQRRLRRPYDVIILGGYPFWENIPEDLRARVWDRVNSGTGLIQFGARDSFLQEMEARGAKPVDATEVQHLSGTLDRWAIGSPPDPFQSYRLGKGVVAVVKFRPAFQFYLTAPLPESGFQPFECKLARVARIVAFTAGRKPPVTITAFGGQHKIGSPGQTSLELTSEHSTKCEIEFTLWDSSWRLRKEWEVQAELKAGRNSVNVPLTASLPTGQYVVAARVLCDGKASDWGAAGYEVARNAKIVSLKSDRETYGPGDTATLHAQYEGPTTGVATFTLSDSFGRELARSETPTAAEMTAQLPLRSVRAISNEVRLTIRSGEDCLAEASTEVVVPFRRTKDYYFLSWRAGFGQDARSINVARILHSYGLDVITNGGFLSGKTSAPYGMPAVPYSMSTHGLLLDKHLFNQEHIEGVKKSLREGAAGARQYGVFAYTLGDEPYVSAFVPEGRFSNSDTVRKAFQAFLQKSYGDVGALNRQWETQFPSFDAIVFEKEDDLLRNPGNPSPWCDYRMFVTDAFTGLLRVARATLKEVDPDVPVGFDGSENYSSYDGYDWYDLCQLLDMPGLYLRPPCPHKLFNVYCVRSFAKPGAINGYWLNERDWESVHYAPWHSVFIGFNTFWWWESNYSGAANNLLAPDFRPSVLFEPMRRELDEIKSGVATLLRQSQLERDGIAIHYSQNNFHASTLACGNIKHIVEVGHPYPQFDVNPAFAGHYAHASKCWYAILGDLGLNHEMIARQQIEKGELTNDRFKVLVLPFVQSLSEQEAAAIRKFVDAGGTVIADYMAGIRDAHCRPVSPGPLDEVFGLRRKHGEIQRNARIRIHQFWGQLTGTHEDVIVETGIEPTTAANWGVASGGIPVLLVNPFGKGKAVTLNFSLYSLYDIRREGRERLMMEMFRRLLGYTSSLKPREVPLDEEGLAAGAVEMYHFRDGDHEYLGMLPDIQGFSRKPVQGRIRVPQGLHHYDVRSGQYLGDGREVPVRLRPGDAVLLASLPYRVTGVTATTSTPQVDGGAVVDCEGAIQASAGEPGRHVLHVQVLRPRGEREKLYEDVVEAPNGRFRFRLPTALNDRRGMWTLRFRDVATSSAVDVTFEIR